VEEDVHSPWDYLKTEEEVHKYLTVAMQEAIEADDKDLVLTNLMNALLAVQRIDAKKKLH
jgi:DNA-binding phage protein